MTRGVESEDVQGAPQIGHGVLSKSETLGIEIANIPTLIHISHTRITVQQLAVVHRAMTKTRFTAADVRAMVRDLRSSVLGLRLVNVYDLDAKVGACTWSTFPTGLLCFGAARAGKEDQKQRYDEGWCFR